MTRAAIIIPARYGSTRFPGKPLAPIAGRAMLWHVWDRAHKALQALSGGTDIAVCVATDDSRILDFCTQNGFRAVMTSPACRTGSDRVLEAADIVAKADGKPVDIALNLQGDNPFVAPEAIAAVLGALLSHDRIEVATPVIRLDWASLDALRDQKKAAPFSGTTVTLAPVSGPAAPRRALWFSKHIIPAMRGEDKLRAAAPQSPVYRHIGLYGYRLATLRRFADLPEAQYEALEGLEQLRFLENGIDVWCAEIPANSVPPISGIDTAEDLARAQNLIESGVYRL